MHDTNWNLRMCNLFCLKRHSNEDTLRITASEVIQSTQGPWIETPPETSVSAVLVEC